MALTMVIADGGVASLLACAVAGQRAATGPAGSVASCLLPPLASVREQAAATHAKLFGLTTEPLRIPADGAGGSIGRDLRVLLEAAILASGRGGGDISWPITATGTDGEPDVSTVAAAFNQALLVSQLVSAASPAPAVRLRAPYVDLTDRQVADLVLDMDLPIWMCWWMAPDEELGSLREEAAGERAKWSRLLKEAGWAGSLESKIVVRPLTQQRAGSGGVA